MPDKSRESNILNFELSIFVWSLRIQNKVGFTDKRSPSFLYEGDLATLKPFFA